MYQKKIVRVIFLIVIIAAVSSTVGCRDRRDKPPAPVADFLAVPTSGMAPLIVFFTDKSENFPTAWAWDFDEDGITDSREQNPSFTYTQQGNYDVTLTVANKGGFSKKTVANCVMTFSSLTIVSDIGDVEPPPGDYCLPLGTEMTACASPLVYPDIGQRYVCEGYVGTGDVGFGTECSVHFTLTRRTTITWVWKLQYELVCAWNAGGTVTPGLSTWHDEGTQVEVDALPDSDAHFVGWSGDLSGDTTPQTVTMNAMRSVTAMFYVNKAPSVSTKIEHPEKKQAGLVILQYNLSDPDDDPVSLSVEYSEDGGSSYYPAAQAGGDSLSGMSAPVGGADYEFIWDAYGDIGNCYQNDVLLRVTPADNYHIGSPGNSSQFTLRQVVDPPANGALVQYPYDGAVLSNCSPVISIAYATSAGTIIPDSLELRINGLVEPVAFHSTGVGAVSFDLISAPLDEGFNTISVSVFTSGGSELTASADFFCRATPVPWPFAPMNQPHKLGHLNSQYQLYGGSPYFHHGIDIMEPGGTALYALVSGTVTHRHYDFPSTYYYEVAITDEFGFVWQYHHVDETTVPQAILDAISNGTTIAQGTWLGNIVTWPWYDFHHTHLNCLDPGGNLVNPLNLMITSEDTTKPTIRGLYITDNQGDTSYNTPSNPEPTVSGQVDLVFDAYDRDDYLQYMLTIREVRYRVIQMDGGQDNHVPPTLLWNFDRLPGGGDRYANVWDVFRQILYVGTATYHTEGNYTQHRFLYVPTNATSGIPNDASGMWDTTQFPNGSYRIYATASDENGNDSTTTLDVIVDNP